MSRDYPLVYLSAAELAWIYTTKVSYIQHLASKHKWGRIRHPDRGVIYRLDDADKALVGHTEDRRERLIRQHRERYDTRGPGSS